MKKRKDRESKEEKEKAWISLKTREAKCYRCGRIGAFKEKVNENVYRCECGNDCVICPSCGKTDDLMAESYSSPNKLCTKRRIVVRPGRSAMIM
jgi:hypothetical protein